MRLHDRNASFVDRRTFLKGAGVAVLGLALPAGMARLADTAGKTVEIEMVTTAENYFDPVGLWVPAGTTVRWVLKSGAHSATAYHPDNFGKPLRIPEKATPWDSGILGAPGTSFEYTFGVEGVYDYFCLPHEALGMVGRIVVGKPGGPGAQPLQPNLFPGVRAVLEKIPPERIVKERVIRWEDR